ncbi:histidine kinase [Anaerobacillus sp. 1_MG-2023]|nr:histidine kinase [Anaerobacillus sp. 1_MG-2023]
MKYEIAWLQAQMNPHIIFNTLNTIVSLSEKDHSQMLRLLEEFVIYLRNNHDIFNTESVIPVAKELELIKSFLFIQKERFGDRIQVKWEIDSLDFKIPPYPFRP